jgi:hypothetical protein
MQSIQRTSDRLFASILTLLFAALVLFVAFHHEPWRDEADAWLAARDMTLSQLFHWLGGAGTPGLWYLLLMPLAKLGLPYQSMMLLHALLAIAVAALIAFFAPFPRLFKALIIFSHSIVYEYAIIERSYVLTTLLLLLIAMSLTARRKRWPLTGLLLLLLFNTNAHGFFFAGIISAVLFVAAIVRREFSSSALLGLLIAGAGGILAFVQLLPPQHAQTINTSPHWVVAGDLISQAFFPHIPAYPGAFQHWAHGRMWAAWPMYWGIRIVGLAIFIGIVILLRKTPIACAIAILGALAITYICVFKWYGGERHAGLLFVLIVFCLWISKWPLSGNETFPRAVRAAFAFSLICSVVAGLWWSYRDIRLAYSGGKEAAAFIQSHGLQNAPIAAIPAPQCESILPYFAHKPFWYIGREAYGTFVQWDSNWGSDYKLSESDALARVKREFPRDNNLLLVASKPLHDSAKTGYTLIFQNTRPQFDGNAIDEHYYLYAHTSISSLEHHSAP